MARYRLCGGLAIMPEHDMAMLADMSARGWHLSGFSCGILYRFEAGEPHAYDYAVDFQRDFSAEAQELYRIGGWQSVALGSSWQIVRAEAGAVPLYTDDDAQARAGRAWAGRRSSARWRRRCSSRCRRGSPPKATCRGRGRASRPARCSPPGSCSRSSPSSAIRARCARCAGSRRRIRAADARPYLGYTVQATKKGARHGIFR